MKHIVNRQGKMEKFDERKVYASCYSACLGCCQMHSKEVEKICETVTSEIKTWIKSKEIVTSDAIFKETAKRIKKHSKEGAYMYETHRDLS